MIEFSLEPVATCWDEVMSLAREHWAGTQTYRRHEPFCPSRERYESMNKQGYFFLFTARDQGALVGYFGVYITPSMHSQLLTATEDTFFLSPACRNGRTALRFLLYVEAFCQERGVHEILFSCEVDNNSGIHGLLTALKYRPVIQMYSKLLDKPENRAQDRTVSLTTPCADSTHDASKEVLHVCSVTAART
jgi:hypothetical protein